MNSKIVYGSRLQVTCRALGLSYKEVGKWIKNSNRHYPDRWSVTGVELSEADAQALQTHLDNKRAKEQAKRAAADEQVKQQRDAFVAALSASPGYVSRSWGDKVRPDKDEASTHYLYDDTGSWVRLHFDTAAHRAQFAANLQERLNQLPHIAATNKRREAAQKRETREIAAICQSALNRFDLTDEDVLAFAQHANTPGDGRVVRTRTACTEDFDTKVYMALVAWVRHNKTDYDAERRAEKDAAYSDYLEAKEFGYDRDERAELLDEARDAISGVRDRLHKKYTAEAVAWLEARAKKQVNSSRAQLLNALARDYAGAFRHC